MTRILLVEDDASVRLLMEHVLIADGYQVDPAATAAAGRMLLARNRYELVLTDGVLPDGTGMEVADDAHRRGIRAIIVIAYGFRFPLRELAPYEVLLSRYARWSYWKL